VALSSLVPRAQSNAAEKPVRMLVSV
jgi:hypothetical protein